MGKVQRLSIQVANQIAAGEVVERPVAVIKELVENSLDAGAKRVSVQFSQGGRKRMVVEDDGAGMSPEDARLALERHATSKINRAEDLNQITSFGFRGEALPSIASVSHFTLRTREETAEAGTELFINGGTPVHERAVGMAPGTHIEVAQLFSSVPARRKFLKTDRTEAAHIIQYCRLVAAAHPEVHFSLEEDGRLLFRSPSGVGLRERLDAIFGRTKGERLLELEAEEEEGLRVHGLMGAPGVGRATRHDLIVYANRRPIENRTLSMALLEAYHTYLPRGRYPVAFLFLEIDPAAMDVNVHPAKREVRFREEGRVRRLVMEAALETLERASRATGPRRAEKPDEAGPRKGGETISRGGAEAQRDVAEVKGGAPEVDGGIEIAAEAKAAFVEDRARESQTKPPPNEPLPGRSVGPVEVTAARGETARPSALTKGRVQVPRVDTSPRLGWTYLGPLHKSWAIFQTPTGLLLLHVQAARARVLYETVLGVDAAARRARQPLLFAPVVVMDPPAVAALEQHSTFLDDHGITLEPFGRDAVRVEAVPGWLPEGEAEGFIRDLAGLLRERGTRADDRGPLDDALGKLACSRVTRGELPRTTDAVQALAGQLMQCRQPLTDPLGRPTLREWTLRDLEKAFGRVE